MSKIISVMKQNQPIYEIHLQPDFQSLPGLLAEIGYNSSTKICIVSDSNVANIYESMLISILKSSFSQIHSFVFQAGEQQKNLHTIELLYEDLINNHFERNDLLIALGGGVTGDMTGFAAATYLRGIDFIQIPTSLLSQVDSSIGGKTGVDLNKYKNMVGAFYQPKLVYMNLNVLNTLPDQQFYAGMGEIIKHGLIKDKSYFQWLSKQSEKILQKDFHTLEEMIYRSCLIKKQVVENDPNEKGERALLNYGHTIGHAIEMKMDFKYLHGECVALGIVAAAHISMKNGVITKQEFDSIIQLLKLYHLPVCLKSDQISATEILDITKNDKKMEAGKIKFILLKEIGTAYIEREVSDQSILESIDYLLKY